MVGVQALVDGFCMHGGPAVQHMVHGACFQLVARHRCAGQNSEARVAGAGRGNLDGRWREELGAGCGQGVMGPVLGLGGCAAVRSEGMSAVGPQLLAARRGPTCLSTNE